MKELQELEGKLDSVTDKAKLVENRRNTESNAFSSDVLTLKKKVADYEKYIKKLK